MKMHKFFDPSFLKNRLYLLILMLGTLTIIVSYIALINVNSWGVLISLSLLAISSILSMLMFSLLYKRRIGSIFIELNFLLERFENDDFDCPATIHADKEVRRYCQRFNDVIAIHQRRVIAAAELLSTCTTATANVQTSSVQLDQNIQQQTLHAASIQQALEEMIYTVVSTAEVNQKAVSGSIQSSKAAKDGGQIVQQTVDKIKQISMIFNESIASISEVGKSCDEIGHIVSLISKIASQTNLLALNAAIEAARAGEDGRGFAVVAEEVRNLAKDTSEATKKIESVVTNIQSGVIATAEIMNQVELEVTEGLHLADRAGQALEGIVTETEQVLAMVGGLASANDESADTAIDKTAVHIDRISTVTNETQNNIQDAVELLKEHREYLAYWFCITEEFPKLAAKFDN
jgi:methyl-accepting chemotaxis protein